MLVEKNTAFTLIIYFNFYRFKALACTTLDAL